MKKIILSIMLTVACLTDMQAQTASQLFSQFRHEKNAEYTHVPAVMWKVFKSLVGKDDKEARFFMKHIRSIRTLDMEDCSQQVKARFHSAVGRLKTSGYTELIRSNEDDERTMILVKEVIITRSVGANAISVRVMRILRAPFKEPLPLS